MVQELKESVRMRDAPLLGGEVDVVVKSQGVAEEQSRHDYVSKSQHGKSTSEATTGCDGREGGWVGGWRGKTHGARPCNAPGGGGGGGGGGEEDTQNAHGLARECTKSTHR